jgi:pseudouridine synthase
VDWQEQRITRLGHHQRETVPIVLALHKPRGAVTTRRDERGRPTVYESLPDGLPWLFPVGRLDLDSEGLLIFTNDSALAVRLTEPSHRIPKTYRVTVRGRPSPAALKRLRAGLVLADGPTLPAGARVLKEGEDYTVLEVVLSEGRNRQVRRMFAAIGHKVRRLVRVGIGRFRLGTLPQCATRLLDASEIKDLLSR